MEATLNAHPLTLEEEGAWAVGEDRPSSGKDSCSRSRAEQAVVYSTQAAVVQQSIVV
jgi:hypothetical protein